MSDRRWQRHRHKSSLDGVMLGARRGFHKSGVTEAARFVITRDQWPGVCRGQWLDFHHIYSALYRRESLASSLNSSPCFCRRSSSPSTLRVLVDHSQFFRSLTDPPCIDLRHHVTSGDIEMKQLPLSWFVIYVPLLGRPTYATFSSYSFIDSKSLLSARPTGFLQCFDTAGLVIYDL